MDPPTTGILYPTWVTDAGTDTCRVYAAVVNGCTYSVRPNCFVYPNVVNGCKLVAVATGCEENIIATG